MRIKATHQINGSLDNINMLAERVCLDWDAASRSWIKRPTRNPAALFRHVLQSAANWQPVSDAAIDLALLQDWHDFCRAKGLHYDRELSETGSTLREVLTEIAAAGRATPRHDGIRWGVVIDRPQDLIVDHISPRNSWAFSARRAYVTPPHALRIKFFDAANDYRPAERLVRWPGHTGEIVLTEEMPMPGKTDATEVWREGYRRALEIIHRPDTYQATQDGPARVATRGDLVSLSQDVLDGTQVAARVRATEGTLIELDEEVEIVAGEAYGLRFRQFANATDVVGQSVVLPVSAPPGWTRTLTADDPATMPEAGDLVMIGRRAKETFQMRVTGIEAAQDMASLIRMVDAAPIIDQLTDSVAIPAWSSRVGQELDLADIAPATPRFTGVSTGVEGTETAGLIAFLIAPGASPIPIATYRIEHRRKGTSAWTVFTIPVANGGGTIDGYTTGDPVEMRATARTSSGRASAATATLTFVVGANDAPMPEALDADSVSLTALPGGATIRFSTGADADTTQVQIYRSQTSGLDRAQDRAGAPIAVTPRKTYATTLGDGNRPNLIRGGDMASPAAWDIGEGWSIANGVATHGGDGTAGTLSQSIAPEAGRWFRIGLQVTVAAGTLTPRLEGGSRRPGTTRTASGLHLDRIQAVSGNDRFALAPSPEFEGTVDDVVVFRETPACLDQGTHHIWLEPQNGDGVPGPVLGPFSITII
ncbi:hypothetical protein [Falsirhodobacter halotolerans]|uniref:hypothetical protein n=1 Tax=Falsirhodobacter halotolerans TaxID=1146892 RepID=UPI001FD312C8|nr:hypothetical protein [Falsirhodobacter halotolerans]MCJ8139893.1 hypothetical protein [Falsirhodobacter halotolerans]